MVSLPMPEASPREDGMEYSWDYKMDDCNDRNMISRGVGFESLISKDK